MKKKQAKDLLYLCDKCPECKKGKMKVVEGFINIGNFFLRCENCVISLYLLREMAEKLGIKFSDKEKELFL